jgi:hypothetical protein
MKIQMDNPGRVLDIFNLPEEGFSKYFFWINVNHIFMIIEEQRYSCGILIPAILPGL